MEEHEQNNKENKRYLEAQEYKIDTKKQNNETNGEYEGNLNSISNKDNISKDDADKSNANEENNEEELKHETIGSNFKMTARKKGGKSSSKSSNMYQTNKSTKFKTTKDFNKKNPALVYMKELKRCAELNRKRNQTARLPPHKLKISDVSFTSKLTIPVYKSSKIILEETHQKMINEMNNPKNPYSAYWSNKILERRYKMEFGVNGFINGVPIITIQKLKSPLKKLKEETEEEEEAEAEAEAEMKDDADQQFNTNRKNFFKVRKDIVEEEVENEEDNNNKEHLPSEIEFGLIYKYFDTRSNNSKNKNNNN